jgi:hypothetical protein
VNANPIPRGALRVKLTVRGGAAVVFGEQLDLPISDPRILKLNAGHDGLSHLPVRPFIALKIGIGDGT